MFQAFQKSEYFLYFSKIQLYEVYNLVRKSSVETILKK